MHLILPKCTLFFRNAPDSRKNAPCFQKCTRLSKKCTPLFQKCTLKNQKCTRAFSLGAFFYQNRCTKPKGYADIDRMSEYPLFFQTLWYQRLLRFTAQLRDPFILPIEPFFALFVPRYKRNQFEIVQL